MTLVDATFSLGCICVYNNEQLHSNTRTLRLPNRPQPLFGGSPRKKREIAFWAEVCPRMQPHYREQDFFSKGRRFHSRYTADSNTNLGRYGIDWRTCLPLLRRNRLPALASLGCPDNLASISADAARAHIATSPSNYGRDHRKTARRQRARTHG